MNKYVYEKFYTFLLLLTLISCSKETSIDTIDEESLCEQKNSRNRVSVSYMKNPKQQSGIIMDKYCALGASTASMEWQKNVATAVAKEYRCYATPGARWTIISQNSDNIMSNQLIRFLKDKDETGYYPDLITIMCGLNDATGCITGSCIDSYRIDKIADINITEWNSDSKYLQLRKSVYGSMRYIIECLKKHFPQSCIIIMTPQQTNNKNYKTGVILRINQIIKSITGKNNIAVVDIYNECGINSTNTKQYLDDMQLHPNKEGEKLLKAYVENQIRLKYND